MFGLNKIDPSWEPIIQQALASMNKDYLTQLSHQPSWLPGPEKIFNAFKVPLENTQYILFGESPYPRQQSANGFAFWDNAVTDLWSEKGLSTTVNRATSLRNIMKMLLLSEYYLTAEDCSQAAIAQLDKAHLVSNCNELFTNFIRHGFLLLNASLVLSNKPVKKEAQYWLPFIDSLLQQLLQKKPSIKLLLFGRIAQVIQQLPCANQFPQLVAEHPYNLSFITNSDILAFFQPLHLLLRRQ